MARREAAEIQRAPWALGQTLVRGLTLATRWHRVGYPSDCAACRYSAFSRRSELS